MSNVYAHSHIMIKEKILQILDLNKERIENTFDIDYNGIDDIRKFLDKDYNNFKDIVDSIFLSNMGNREKMVMHYLIGYANGRR
jgi:hypothetical protein